jgi:DNA-directed RNA polymerase alpha subunit
MAAKNSIIVFNEKEEDMRPVFGELDRQGECAALLPKHIFPVKYSFEVKGINAATSNAIRRVIASEIVTRVMDVETQETNDEFILGDYVRERIRMVPLMQNVPLDTKFKIDYINNTSNDIIITTANVMNQTFKVAPFMETIPLFTLHAGRYAKYTLTVTSGRGREHGCFTLACAVVSLAKDQEPFDIKTQKGVPSSISDPRHFEIGFETNGTIKPRAVVTAACDELVERCKYVRSMLYSIIMGDKYNELILHGETDTVGNLVLKNYCDLFPDGKGCVYSVKTTEQYLSIRILDENPKDIIELCLKKAINDFEAIRAFFSK